MQNFIGVYYVFGIVDKKIIYLVGPYYTGPKLNSMSALIGVIFECSRSNSLRQTCNAGPYNAISRKTMPFRAGVIVIRANMVAVYRTEN